MIQRCLHSRSDIDSDGLDGVSSGLQCLFVQLAGRLALNQETEVRTLDRQRVFQEEVTMTGADHDVNCSCLECAHGK